MPTCLVEEVRTLVGKDFCCTYRCLDCGRQNSTVSLQASCVLVTHSSTNLPKAVKGSCRWNEGCEPALLKVGELPGCPSGPVVAHEPWWPEGAWKLIFLTASWRESRWLTHSFKACEPLSRGTCCANWDSWPKEPWESALLEAAVFVAICYSSSRKPICIWLHCLSF